MEGFRSAQPATSTHVTPSIRYRIIRGDFKTFTQAQADTYFPRPPPRTRAKSRRTIRISCFDAKFPRVNSSLMELKILGSCSLRTFSIEARKATFDGAPAYPPAAESDPTHVEQYAFYTAHIRGGISGASMANRYSVNRRKISAHSCRLGPHTMSCGTVPVLQRMVSPPSSHPNWWNSPKIYTESTMSKVDAFGEENSCQNQVPLDLLARNGVMAWVAAKLQ